MDSWGRWHPGQRGHPEAENMASDDGRTWKPLWPESRALWGMVTTRLRRKGRVYGLENDQEGSQEDLGLWRWSLPKSCLLPGGLGL